MRSLAKPGAFQRPGAIVASNLRGLTALAALLGFLFLSPAYANGNATIRFSIPPQALSSGLIEFSRQANVQVLTAGSRLKGIRTSGVTGRYSVADGIRHLLSRTGFGYHLIGTDTISLIPPSERKESANASDLPKSADSSDPALDEVDKVRRKNLQRGGGEEGSLALQEVIVTAQKYTRQVHKFRSLDAADPVNVA
jgi:hypothetical protein